MMPLLPVAFLLVFALVAIILIVYIQPHSLLKLANRLFPRVLFCVNVTTPVCAITIDDVPSQHTAAILDALRDCNARATLFVIGGNVASKEYDGRALLLRALREGHELGNHTWHDRASVSLPLPQLTHEVERVETLLAELEAATGGRPRRQASDESAGEPRGGGPRQRLLDVPKTRWFRPGHGWFSSAVLDVAARAGLRTALGSVFPFDPAVQSVAINSTYLRYRVHPGGVVILHDGAGRWATAATLRAALPALQARGFEFVTLSELCQIAK